MTKQEKIETLERCNAMLREQIGMMSELLNAKHEVIDSILVQLRSIIDSNTDEEVIRDKITHLIKKYE